MTTDDRTTAPTLYIIPARGGSKGIPGKNIKPLAGRPLIGYAIANALELADPDDICVSTDSVEIAAVAERLGVKVPFLRPAGLATDTAATYDVLLHALDWYAAAGRDYGRIVLLQPTSPLVTPDDIRGALRLWTPETDMVVSVTEARTNPYYNAFETDSDGYLHISKGDGLITRRQDAPKVWEYNGAVYVITVSSLRATHMSQFRRRIPFEMPASRSVDLDTPADWLVAEQLIGARR